MIELKNISKTFVLSDGSVDALNDVSLSIEDGDIYGIIGASGAGKSTLVRCINMLERPTSGSVIIDNTDICKLSEKQLREERKKIAMIFQGFNLMMQKNCLKNVCFIRSIMFFFRLITDRNYIKVCVSISAIFIFINI